MALDFGGQFLPVVPGDFFHHAHLAPCRNEDRFECGETRSVKNHRVIDVTSIVIDVTSMESLHKLMVFPSHTMYSSLCHVPNRAQTGPKQGPNSSESWPYSTTTQELIGKLPSCSLSWKRDGSGSLLTNGFLKIMLHLHPIPCARVLLEPFFVRTCDGCHLHGLLKALCHVTVARSFVFSARKRLSATTQGWSWEVTLWHKAMTHRSSTRHSSFLDCFLETKNTRETRHKFYVITVVVNSTILFAKHFWWITSIISISSQISTSHH